MESVHFQIGDGSVWLRQQRARVSPKSRLGEKLAYIGNHWAGLKVFLTDGRVEMDNNIAYADNCLMPTLRPKPLTGRAARSHLSA